MARIDKSFTMQATPDLAQERFKEDIGPELHRGGGFVLFKERPGRLLYSDGIVDPVAFAGTDGFRYAGLRALLAHKMRVRFTGTPTGTSVNVHGSASRALCDAIGKLGEPGQWPEVG